MSARSFLPPDPDTTRYFTFNGDMQKYHSLDQIVEYGNARAKAARIEALEEAARKVLDIYSYRPAYSAGVLSSTTLDTAAAAIRSLK